MERHKTLELLSGLRLDLVAEVKRYGATTEFPRPRQQVEALDQAIHDLSLEGPLTFSARYYKAKYEALAVDPDDATVLRALLAAKPGITVYTDTEFNQMKAALKAAFGPRCTYPDCNCPFDAPANPEWCARGLPRDS